MSLDNFDLPGSRVHSVTRVHSVNWSHGSVPDALPPELLEFFESMSADDQTDLRNAAKVKNSETILFLRE